MLIQDFIYGARTLRKAPGFALTAALTIALGIGASTAIFSVTNAVLLRPLPYRDPERLVFAISEMRTRHVKDFPVSNADYLDLREGTKDVFEGMAALNTGRNAVPKQDGTLEETHFGVATPNFFGLMGGHIAFGRDFTEADGVAGPPPVPGQPPPPGPPQATILSYEYFQRRFGGDSSIIGRGMPGAPPGATVIVGVLAPGFELLFPADANMERVPDTWFAARIPYDNVNRNNVQWRVIARMRPGVTVERALASAEQVSENTRKNFLIANTAGYHFRLEAMHQHVVEAVRPALLALMGAVIFLLLISCANVANLLLVRASMRERELAVRTALGGSRWRLVSQTLVESLLVSVSGALIGLAMAWAGIRELRAIAPPNLPRLDLIDIDVSVLAFTALTAIAAAAIFGIAPALRASRPDVAQVLRASGRTAGLGGGLVRSGVVMAEVALSFVLLIGSGLMFRSFVAIYQIQPGFDPHGLLTFQALRGGGGGPTTPQQRAAFIHDIQDRLKGITGVEAVTACFPLPLGGGFTPIRWGLEPALSDPTKFQAVDWEVVLPGYFEAMRTPAIAGRTFTDADNDPSRKVVVIDQALAARAYPNENAVGKRILFRLRTPQPEWFEVIGVVGHQREASLAEPGREQVFFTDGYMTNGFVSRWVVRASGDPTHYASAVRTAMAKLGSRVVTTDLQPMDSLVDRAAAGTRFSLLLIGVFATIAALLAAVGLYGVLSTVVRQRTAEIGVRMALGATPGSIFQLVVGQGLRLSGGGIALGLVAAFALTRVMTTMLVGVKATDPPTFAAMAVLFLTIAAVASWLPGRRAARLDPTVALRDE